MLLQKFLNNVKIKHKLFLSFFLSFFFIAGIGGVSFYGIEKIVEQSNYLIEDTTPAIIKIDELSKLFLTNVEEAYSYITFGSLDEKDGYHDNKKKFDARLDEIKEIAGYGKPDAAEFEVKLIDNIFAEEAQFNQTAEAIFLEYEKKGSVNTKSVRQFALHVDTMLPFLEEYIKFERAEVVEANEKIADAYKSVINLFFTTLVLSLIVFGVVSWLILRSITQPALLLLEAATAMGKGDFTKRVPVMSSTDEMGVLGEVFNTMADNIKQSHSILESRVAERTAELEKIKLGLEDAVEERTTEVHKKMAEMEELNKELLGREVRMAELKKENGELKSKLGGA